MVFSKNTKFKSFLPPILITTISGQKYVCPGWHKVSNNMSLNEVYKNWEQEILIEEPKPKSLISEFVKSSNGSKEYLVNFDGINWFCTCTGFGFRRKCKHVDYIKNKNL